jgi:hypothetical protein
MIDWRLKIQVGLSTSSVIEMFSEGIFLILTL